MTLPADKPVLMRPAAQPVDTEERQRRARIASKAREFIIHLDTLAKHLRIHAITNDSVRNHIQALGKDVEALRSEGQTLTIVFAEGHTFVNGVWVRANKTMWGHAVELTETFSKMKARGVVLEPHMEMNALVELATTLHQAAQFPEPRDVEFRSSGLRLVPAPDPESGAMGRNRVREGAFNIIKEGMQLLGNEEVRRLDIFMRRRRRGLVQKLVQMAEESTEELLALTSIRSPNLPPGIHTLMVTIFSIGLGRVAGLSRRDLVRLGIAALNHNLGESFVDQAIFARPRALTPEEKLTVEMHPLIGMRHMLEHYGMERGMLECAFVIAEHHIHWDGASGYPFSTNATTHAFSRMIAIADTFNALLSERPHRKAYPPDQALKLVIRAAGQQLDPVLVRAFVSLVGRYPSGSVVEMDTGEWGVVLGPGRGKTPLKRPRVLIITDEDGFEIPSLYVVDLGERHAHGQGWVRTILRTHDPGQLDFKLASYLLADRLEKPPQFLDSDPGVVMAPRGRRA